MTPDTITRAEYLLAERELVLALSLFNRAQSEGADLDRCAAGRWMAFMLSGDFPAAWSESDAIRLRCGPDVHRYWQGEHLYGQRVLVRCLHGFGDSVQMLRFVPALKALGVSRLIVECAPQAVALVQCMCGIDQVITWGADAPRIPPAFDVQIEVMELPYILRTTITTLPSATQHLQLPIEVIEQARKVIDAKSATPRIGIVWSAGEWNQARSIPLDMLRPVLRESQVHFWNLQGGKVRNEWRSISSWPHLHDAVEFTNAGLVSLAALMTQIDLIITVDTLAAHLAGSLNVPCFLLLQYAADWRWMVERADSPWYPSLRLFRQPRPGDWQSAVDEMNSALRAWARTNCVERSVA
jgi:hypothetical protein